VLRGSRRDFIERLLIVVALVVERHPQLDRKIGGPIGRTSTPGTDAIASRFSSTWFVSIIGTMATPSFPAPIFANLVEGGYALAAVPQLLAPGIMRSA
jgi:hypothetical protein